MNSPLSGQCSPATASTNGSFKKKDASPVAWSKENQGPAHGDSIKTGQLSGHGYEPASHGEHSSDFFTSPWTVADGDCRNSFFDPLDVHDISPNELFQDLERLPSSEGDFSSFDSEDWHSSIGHGLDDEADPACLLSCDIPELFVLCRSSHERRCEECKKDFRYPKDLSRHLQSVHSLNRPYKCPVTDCKYFSMGFARKDNQKRHVSKKHPEMVTVVSFEL